MDIVTAEKQDKLQKLTQQKLDEDDDVLIGMQTVKDTDLFARPGRLCRPNRLAIILRGLPGSGKSMVARHIERTERKYGKKTKVFAWDEYFKEVKLNR